MVQKNVTWVDAKLANTDIERHQYPRELATDSTSSCRFQICCGGELGRKNSVGLTGFAAEKSALVLEFRSPLFMTIEDHLHDANFESPGGGEPGDVLFRAGDDIRNVGIALSSASKSCRVGGNLASGHVRVGVNRFSSPRFAVP